jgi:hypothetical protein
VTDHLGFEDLIDQLECFGDALDFDDADVSNEVLDRIVSRRRPRSRHRWFVAAAVVLMVTGAVLHPDSRQAVARWFGFDGLVVEVDPDLQSQALREGFDAPGPGESLVVEIDGREILVSAVRGEWNDGLITKSVGSSDQIEEVDIGGLRGLWISGAPHQVLYEVDNGEVVVDRVAANTLVWQDADVLYRVEGFANLPDALAFVNEGT